MGTGYPPASRRCSAPWRPQRRMPRAGPVQVDPPPCCRRGTRTPSYTTLRTPASFRVRDDIRCDGTDFGHGAAFQNPAASAEPPMRNLAAVHTSAWSETQSKPVQGSARCGPCGVCSIAVGFQPDAAQQTARSLGLVVVCGNRAGAAGFSKNPPHPAGHWGNARPHGSGPERPSSGPHRLTPDPGGPAVEHCPGRAAAVTARGGA